MQITIIQNTHGNLVRLAPDFATELVADDNPALLDVPCTTATVVVCAMGLNPLFVEEIILTPLLSDVAVLALVSFAAVAETVAGVIACAEAEGDAAVEEDGTPPASLYQFARGSPIHSPTVTALYPLAFSVSNMYDTKLNAVFRWMSCASGM